MGSMSDHVHIYVDASFEEGGYSGLGGVLYSSSGTPMAFFSGQLDEDFLRLVKGEEKQNIIQELEMLALLCAVTAWCPKWKGYRFVIFTDSEAVRGSFLKTWSNSNPCSKL